MVPKRKSPLDVEILETLSQERLFIFPKIEITLHIEKTDMTLTHVTELKYTRNFNTNISDVIVIEFIIGLGTFRDIIFSNRDKLEISIYYSYNNKAIKNHRFKAVLMTEFPESYDSVQSKYKASELDTQDMVVVKCQCLDPLTLALKNRFISGVWHDYTIEYFMQSLLNYELNKIKILGRNFTYKINIHKPDNDKVYKNILIKPYTKLIKLPYVLQNEMYGIYNGGVNVYFSTINYGGEYKSYTGSGSKLSQYLFSKEFNYDINIFPLFDYDRFDKEDKQPKLLLINPATPEAGYNNNDFYYKDGVYKLIVNDIKFKDITEKNRYDHGTAVSYCLPDKHIDIDNFTIENDSINYDAKAVNVLDVFDKNLYSYTNVLNTDLDENIFKYYSNLNKNQGVIGIIKIAKINPDFIYPGMPFKYIYTKENKPKETTGIIQSVEYFYDFPNKTILTVIVGMFKKI